MSCHVDQIIFVAVGHQKSPERCDVADAGTVAGTSTGRHELFPTARRKHQEILLMCIPLRGVASAAGGYDAELDTLHVTIGQCFQAMFKWVPLAHSLLRHHYAVVREESDTPDLYRSFGTNLQSRYAARFLHAVRRVDDLKHIFEDVNL